MSQFDDKLAATKESVREHVKAAVKSTFADDIQERVDRINEEVNPTEDPAIEEGVEPREDTLEEAAGRLIQTFDGKGVVAKVYKTPDEFVVKFWRDGKYQTDADYFADDKEDAIETAKHETGK